MLRIDLSGMNRAELRRLLATAEARGQEGLAATFRAELAARQTGESGPPAPAAAIEAFDDEPDPIVVRAEPPPLALDPARRRAPAARRWPVGLAATIVLIVGGAAAWSLNGTPGWPGREGGTTPAPRAMTVRSLAAPARAPAPAVASEPPAPAPPPPSPTPTTQATAAPTPEAGPRRLDPCARPPTPADGLLCNDLGLNLLEHELREAYGRALDAGADPAAVRESQAAWRRARDPTTDPRALAGLYDRRIRDLRALAALGAAKGPSELPPPDDRQRN